MAIGTCDPATRGTAFNTQQLAMGNGTVQVIVKYGWDGVSVQPECVGPLVQSGGWAIQVTNNDSRVWYLHTVGKRGQPHDLAFQPGVTVNYTANQARQAGYETIADIAELTLTTSPTR